LGWILRPSLESALANVLAVSSAFCLCRKAKILKRGAKLSKANHITQSVKSAARVIASALLVVWSVLFAASAAQAATVDWGSVANGTNLLTTPVVITSGGVTVTATTVASGSFSANSSATSTGSANGSGPGIISLSMNANTDDESAFQTTTFTFSQPVTNATFTIRDIDGGINYTGGFHDIVEFTSSAGFPTAVITGAGVTYNSLTGRAEAAPSNNGISDLRGNMTVSWAGPVTSITIKHIAGRIPGIAGFPSDPSTEVIVIDDLTFGALPTLQVTKISNGGTGTFNFTGDNGFGSDSIVTTVAGTGVAGVTKTLAAVGTSTTVTESSPGWAISSVTCTGIGPSGSVSFTGNSFSIFGGGVVADAVIACTVTNVGAILQLQKTSFGGTGTFSYTQTNLVATPANITTTIAGLPAPTPLTAIQVTALGTAITLTEGAVAGYAITSASCIDSNSAVTGNTGIVSTLAGNVLTIPASKVVAGAGFLCSFNNTRATVKVQKITTGGVGGPFNFASTNLASTPPSVFTISTGVATPPPISVGVNNVTTIGTAVTITETPAPGYTLSSASCTDANSAVTGNVGTIGTLAGNVLTIPAPNVKAGADITCVFTNAKAFPTVRVQKSTLGGFGGPFAFTQTNLSATPANITTTAAATPAPVIPTAIVATAAATNITITETPFGSYSLTSASCTDANSAVTGNTGLIGTLTGNTLTIPAVNVVAAADFTCVFTNTPATVKVQKTTVGGFGGPFSFAQTNLASAPAAITTTAAGTPTPAAPSALVVSALGTAVTLTETPAAGYFTQSASCTDANSAVTGNVGAIGTLVGNVLTIPPANVVARADFTCVFTNNKLPTLQITKISNGAVGTFTFAGSNGWANQNITTVTSGVGVAGAVQTLTAAGAVTTITETVPADYALSPPVCTGLGVGGTASFAGGVLTLDAAATAGGSVIACTFTNTRATMKVQKITIGGVGSSGTFADSNVAGTIAAITTTTAGVAAPVSPTPANISNSTNPVTITETPIAGYALTAASCTDANSAVTGNTGTFGTLAAGVLTIPAATSPAIGVKAGADITCVFTNTKRPTLQLTKISNGAVGTFTFTGTNGWASQNITTATIGTGVAGAVQTLTAASTVTTITETVPAGYALSTPVCTGLGAGGTASFAGGVLTLDAAATAPGSVIACTFTNTRANVKLQKITQGGATGPFTFTRTNLTSVIANITTATAGVAAPAPATPNLITTANGATAVTITEGAFAGYALTGASCLDANFAVTGNPSTPIGSRVGLVLTIPAANVVAGADFTCTFTNTRATVSVQKTTTGGFGGPFTFTQTGLASAPANITTTAAATLTPAVLAPISATVGTAVTLTEGVAAGYVTGGVVCTDANSAITANPVISSATASVTIPSTNIIVGTAYNCVFTNTKLPTLTLTKISNGAVGGFTFTGTNGWASQTITTTTSGTGVAGATQTLTAAGVATDVTETVPAGYVLSAPSCTGMGAGGTVSLVSGSTYRLDAAATAAGSNIACTFTNTKTPTVKVQKTTTGGFGGPFSFAQTNLASAPANITTTAAATATPAVPTAINISTIGTDVTLTETPASGYALTAASCTDANSAITGNTGSFGTLVGNVLTIPAANVVAGADFTCVFTNTKLPTVTLTKISNGAIGGFTFTGTNGWSSQTITTTVSGTGVAGALQTLTAAGVSTDITETVPSSYVLSTPSCTGLGAGGTATLSGSTLTLDAAATAAGSNIACTFTNTKTPTVKVQKTTLGGFGGPFSFAQANLGSAPANITTTAAATATPAVPTAINVTTIGTAVTLTETPATGYALTGVSCTDANSAITSNTGSFGSFSGNVVTIPATNIKAGADLTCVITNTKLPTLTLTKISNGAVGGFTFTGTNGWASQTITTVTPGTGVAGATQTLTAAGVATTITETIPSGYAMTAASCSGLGAGTATPNLGAGTIALDAAATAAGNVISCSVTNTKLPTLTLTKISNGAVGGFTFTGTNGWASQTITTVTSGTGVAGAIQTLTAAGVSTDITETVPSGYVLSTPSCTGMGAGGTVTLVSGSTYRLDAAATAAGSNIACTFTNTKLPTITLTKISNGGVGGFTFTGTNGWTSQTITTVTPGTGVAGALQTLTAASTATTLTETIPPGYAMTAASCSGIGAGTATPTLSAGTIAFDAAATAPGNAITCTITNSKLPSLTLVKTITNDNGGSAVVASFPLTATGPTTITGVSGTGAVTSQLVGLGTYVLSETTLTGYAAGSWSCTAGTLTGSSLVLAAGDVATCTINNNDIAPVLTLVKTITNDNGGSAVLASFPLTATGPTTITGVSGTGAVTSQPVTAGTYVLSETTLAGYTAGSWSCTAGTLTGSSLVLVLGQTATCTINNNDIAPVLTLTKTVTNDNGGTAAVSAFTLTATGPTTITGASGAVAVTSASVSAGTYVLSETGPAGYTAGAWSCTAGTLTGSSLVLTPGQTSTCTINNNDISPRLTLVKTVTNDNGGTATVSAFTLTATGPTTITGASGAVAVTNAAVNAGTYVLSEAGPAGYTASAWSCTAGTLTGSSLVLTPGQTSTCTINNNDIAPVLTLVKTITNDNGGSAVVASFPLTATGPTTITGVSGTGVVTSQPVSAGTYVLSETTLAGYAAGSWSCTAGTLTGSSLVLAPGQTSTCTINNNDIAPILTLVKTITNDNGGTATVTSFPLTATGPTTITGVSGTGAVTSQPVSAGTYALSETTLAGYTAGSWSCTAGTLTGSSLALTPGQTATCTINNNDVAPILTLTKTVTNDNGGTSAVSAFTLTATGPTTITGASGAVAVTNAAVNAGTYVLSEAGPAGYTAGAWSCTAGTLTGSSLVLTPGQTSTCTINNNDIAPRLTLVKTVTNDNGGTAAVSAFTLTATGPTTITGASGAVAVTNVAVNAGTYVLSETGPAGYTASAWSCTAGTLTGSSLVLALGQTATCTINNNDISPRLTLVKTITNDNGGTTAVSSVTLTATGPTTITGITAAAPVTNAAVNAGTYTLSESAVPGYAAGAWSCTAGTLTGSSLVLALGQTATCTINNNDIAPVLTLVKTITNDNGGTATVTSFPLTATGPTTITGVSGTGAVTSQPVSAGTYALSETGPAGYAAGAWSCTAGTLTGASLVLALGQTATCTINNNDIAPTLTLRKTTSGGVNTFNFTGTNGFGSDAITTLVAGTPVTGTTKTLTLGNTATDITETVTSGYFLSGAPTCTGMGVGGTVTLISGSTYRLNAAATAIGSAIICSFSNTKSAPRLTILKTSSTLGPVPVGTIITYTYTVTNSGNVAMTGVTVSDVHNGSGVFTGPNNEILLTDVAPLGDSTDAASNGSWDSLAPGDILTFTATYVVTQNDVDTLQ
jgi:Prealbumin-like fold domain